MRFWRIASQPDPLDSNRSELRKAARILLNAVNVVGTPVDCSVSFEELDNVPINRAFPGGSLGPMTLRAHIAALAYPLDNATLKQVAERLLEIAETDPSDLETRNDRFRSLLTLDLDILDSVPNDGMISFNPNHPTRAILEDLERHVGQVKKHHGIEESRRRHDKLPEYFEVWDAREGWTGAGYNRQREQTLSEIARTLRKPLKTVSDRYRSAFGAIFGTAYTPNLWLQNVLPLKFVDGDGYPALPRIGRPLRERTPRPAPESRLSGPGDHVPLLMRAGVNDSELTFSDLRMDMTDLIARGKTDVEICEALELDEGSLEFVAYFRQRSAEGE